MDSNVQNELEAIQWSMDHDQARGRGSWLELFQWGTEGRKAYLGFAIQGRLCLANRLKGSKLIEKLMKHSSRVLESIS